MIGQEASEPMKAFDFEAMLARCLGKRDLVDRALSRFESVIQTSLEELEAAIDGTDAAEITRIAHRLKGASANVSALRLQAHAAEIEKLASAQKLDEVSGCLKQLHKEVSQFSQSTASLWQHEVG